MTHEIHHYLLQLNQIADIEDSFSIKQQIKLVHYIIKDPIGPQILLKLLIERRLNKKKKIYYIDGIIFKSLYNCSQPILQQKVLEHFQDGIVKLKSNNNINYRPLYKSLISNNFKTANHLTHVYLNELAGLNKNNKRQWLYFTDILNLPIQDLKTIDTLWKIYSEGQFGFSIQRQIWLYHDKNWEKFWHKIGWKINKKNIRYPQEFIWDSTAPTGHLPLFNQLRGVQVLATLFRHPAWSTENKL